MSRTHQTLTSLFSDIADAIRAKKGETENAQIWDEEWELGDLAYADARELESDTWIRSKYIPITPDTNYYVYSGTKALNLYFFDENKNYLGQGWDGLKTNIRNSEILTASSARYMRIGENVSQYNHDISINYPSTDTSYHPYTVKVADEFPSEINSITLQSMLPDGIKVVDLGDYDWGKRESDFIFFETTTTVASHTTQSFICPKYSSTKNINEKDKVCTINWYYVQGAVSIRDLSVANLSASEFKEYIKGTLLFIREGE